MGLTEEQIAGYHRDGFLVVPGVVHGVELELLREAADNVMADAIAYGEALDRRAAVQLETEHGFHEWHEFDDRQFLYAKRPDGSRVWRRAEGMWRRAPIFRATTANPTLLAVVEALGGPGLLPAHDSMVVKMPGAGAAVPWHRDPTADKLMEEEGDASPDFICDLYLDESTVDNGCVWALPGTQRVGVAADVAPLDFSGPDAVPLEAQPGDLVIHCTGMLHGSPANTSAKLRRTFYLHFQRPEILAQGWWNRSPEWIDEMRQLLDAAVAERSSVV